MIDSKIVWLTLIGLILASANATVSALYILGLVPSATVWVSCPIGLLGLALVYAAYRRRMSRY